MKLVINKKKLEITPGALWAFKALWDSRFEHHLTPPVTASTLEEKANIAELKKLKVINTFLDGEERFVEFWELGDLIGEQLDLGTFEMPEKPTTKKPARTPKVDKKAAEAAAAAEANRVKAPAPKTRKTTSPAVESMEADGFINLTGAPAAAAEKPKVSRSEDRWAAIRETVAKVKDDKWDTGRDYNPTIKHLTKTYPGLFKRNWTDAKKKVYMEGIVKFALASTRKA